MSLMLAVGATGLQFVQPQTTVVSNYNATIANPFVDYTTLDEANKAAGFDLNIPSDLLKAYPAQSIQAIKGELVQIALSNNATTDKLKKELFIRKGTGTEDISGDYNQYSNETTVTIANMSVTLKGNNNKVSLATWTDGTYAYSVSATENNGGIATKRMQEIVSNIIKINNTELQTGANGSGINPFVEVNTMAEATKKAGFALTAPSSVSKSYPNRLIQVIPNDLIEVRYYTGTGDNMNTGIIIRKGVGKDDVSGDYTKYSKVRRVKIGSNIVSLHSNENRIYLATWTSGNYSYSVSYNDGTSQSVMTQVVKKVK